MSTFTEESAVRGDVPFLPTSRDDASERSHIIFSCSNMSHRLSHEVSAFAFRTLTNRNTQSAPIYRGTYRV